MTKYQVEIYCFDAEICEEEFRWIELHRLGLPRDLLQKMGDLGIIDIRQNHIRTDQMGRIFKALRLRRALGINLMGAGVILDLLEEVEDLQNELEQLKKQL